MFPAPGQRDSLRRSGAVEFQLVIRTAFLYPIECRDPRDRPYDGAVRDRALTETELRTLNAVSVPR
jgi:hypothetical protein